MSRPPRPTRNIVVNRLGTPDKTEESLNDPRTHEEFGFSYNEKWIYTHLRDDPAGVAMRMIYWHRYDFMGTVVRASESDTWRVDDTLEKALSELPDRLYHVDPNRNPPVTPTNRYRPVSDFKGKPDLGGYIQRE